MRRRRPYPEGVEFYGHIIFQYQDPIGSTIIAQRSMTLRTYEGETYSDLFNRLVKHGRESDSRLVRQEAREAAQKARLPFNPEDYPITESIPEESIVIFAVLELNELPRPRRGWRRKR